ncbi:choice-of-anchor I family protein [Cohnella massiliensis]|uniref:choice-of-anchor I family protein n=1 Tax=Cohnella massiliensis TaxID=1816691 RepID=UPI00111B2FE5|nr:choice-of-anchor I family protein [Cohnella massiliensis]
MNRTSKKVLSFFLAAEMLLGGAMAALPASAAEGGAAGAISGVPYAADGSYDVAVPHVVIHQAYGGGAEGASDRFFSNGFIELYNPTDDDVDLNGWTLHYADPTMASGTWIKLDLTGTIGARSSYLVVDGQSDDSFVSDIRGKGDKTWSDAFFYNKGMKVVLMSGGASSLDGVVNPFADKPEGYVDMIGTAGNDNGLTIDGYETDYPTGKAEGTSKKKSVRRESFADTDNNKADFEQIGYEEEGDATFAENRPRSGADGAWGAEAPALGLATETLADATVGRPYSAALSVYGGAAPYTFEASGLPGGLAIDAASGTIAGTPLEAGTASVSVSVYDSSEPRLHLAREFTLAVKEAPALAMPDLLGMTKLGGYSVGVTSEDGGLAEIVQYNRDNGKFYLVNGSADPATLDIVKLNGGANPEKETSVLVEKLAEVDGFVYGDLTSVDINTATKRVAVAVQEADAMKNGKVLVLDYDGKPLESYETGVQPDMVKFSDDGRYILTADEGEPRTEAGDPEGSVTIVDTVAKETVRVKFDDPSVIDDLVHIRGAADPETNFIMGKGSKEDAVFDLEPEYIELSEDQKTAFVSLQENNAIAAIDIASAKVLYVKGLGYKDLNDPRNALDLVKDGEIKLENVPFYGVYMPDGISEYTTGGKTYLFTANEGDATEWPGKENASDVGDLKAALDPESAAALFLAGKSDYDDVEAKTDEGTDGIYLFGGRSFSIWDAETMEQVYDSGNDFEKITAERLPDYFNASNSNTSLDSRSEKKGPEPEYVTVGKVGKRALAFVGLERIGGVMTYDVTDPAAPVFINYFNTREFAMEDNLTDSGPEGLEFIPAADSPTGRPLLLVANEVGGTVAVYQVETAKVTLDQSALSLKVGGAAGTLKATVEGGDAAAVTWSSSDPGVATVDANGNVAPVAAGTAVISAFSGDGYGLAEATVTVAPADAVNPAPVPVPGTGTGNGTEQPGTETPSVEDGKVVAVVNVETDAAGKATAALSEETVEAAIKALESAEGGELVIRVRAGETARQIELTVPAAALTAITGSSAGTVVFETDLGTISLDRDAFAAAAAEAGDDDLVVTIRTVASGSSFGELTPAGRQIAETLIGNRSVVDLTLTVGGRTLSNLGGGTIGVGLPYAPGAGEDPNAIVALYLSEDGAVSIVRDGMYDASSGRLVFQTEHLSRYAVGYNRLEFSDIGASFAKDSVTYLAARDIIGGIGNGRFDPAGGLTRADVAMLLARLAGADTEQTAGASFTDVKAGDYFAGAVAWASQNGIASGFGDGRFDPKAGVTREQLAAMLVRFAGYMNWTLPDNGAAADFADADAIAAVASEAAQAMSRAGIISGKAIAGRPGAYFAPQDTATRAEAAHMLAKLLKSKQ